MRLVPIRLLLVGALLTAGLVVSVVRHVEAVAGGTEIVLAAQGYDPRSILRGQYSEMRFAISQVSGLPWPAGWPDAYSIKDVFVTIVPDRDDWRVAAVSLKRDAAPAEGHVVKASGASYKGAKDSAPANTIHWDLTYGIERIYLQQSEAEAIDKMLRGAPADAPPHVQVVASLGTDGRLRLKAVIVDGKRTDFTWW